MAIVIRAELTLYRNNVAMAMSLFSHELRIQADGRPKETDVNELLDMIKQGVSQQLHREFRLRPDMPNGRKATDTVVKDAVRGGVTETGNTPANKYGGNDKSKKSTRNPR